jgi:hypothetical protein
MSDEKYFIGVDVDYSELQVKMLQAMSNIDRGMEHIKGATVSGLARIDRATNRTAQEMVKMGKGSSKALASIDESSKRTAAATESLTDEIRQSTNEIVTAFQKINRSSDETATKVTRSSGRIAKAIKGAFAGIAAYMTINYFARMGKQAIMMAADVEESENLFTVSMGSMEQAARKWSNSLAKDLGLNAYELRRTTGLMNSMLLSMGLNEQKAYEYSTSLTALSKDLASFYNITEEGAFEKIRSGITGEIKPLRDLGILLHESIIKRTAYTHGIAKQGETLTELQKIQARYITIMEQTQKAQGDLGRTMYSTTNMFRRLGTRVKMLFIEIGNSLNPVIDDLTKKALDITEIGIEFVTTHGPEITQTFKIISTTIVNAASSMYNAIKTLDSITFNNLLNGLKRVLANLSLVINGLSLTADSVGITIQKASAGWQYITKRIGIAASTSSRFLKIQKDIMKEKANDKSFYYFDLKTKKSPYVNEAEQRLRNQTSNLVTDARLDWKTKLSQKEQEREDRNKAHDKFLLEYEKIIHGDESYLGILDKANEINKQVSDKIKSTFGTSADVAPPKDVEPGAGGGGKEGKKKKGKKEATEYQKAKLALERELLENELAENNLSAEEKLKIYQNYLESVKKTEKEFIDYYKGFLKLKDEAYKEHLELETIALQKKIADEKLSFQDITNEKTKLIDEQIQKEKAGTVEYEKLILQKKEIEKDFREYQRTQANSVLEHQLTLIGLTLEAKESEINNLKDLGKISEKQELELLLELENKKYEIRKQGLQDKINIFSQDKEKVKELYRELEILNKEHSNVVKNQQYDIAKAISSPYEQALSKIKGTFNNTIQAIITGSQSLKNILTNIFHDIAAMFTQFVGNKLFDTLGGMFGQKQKTGKGNQKGNFEAAKQGIQSILGLREEEKNKTVGLAKQAAQGVLAASGMEWAQKLSTAQAGSAAEVAIRTAGNIAAITGSKITGAATAASAGAAATASLGATTAAFQGIIGMIAAMAKAIALIPIVGADMAAPIFVGVAAAQGTLAASAAAASVGIGASMAGVAASLAVPSFDVGSWSVPADTLAMVHRNEMIIPANFADKARALASGKESTSNIMPSVQVSYNVTTMDSKGVSEVLKEG